MIKYLSIIIKLIFWSIATKIKGVTGIGTIKKTVTVREVKQGHIDEKNCFNR